MRAARAAGCHRGLPRELLRSAPAAVACRRGLSSSAADSPLPALRREKAEEISQLTEVLQRDRFQQQLSDATCQLPTSASAGLGGMSVEDAQLALDAGMLTFLTHVESRISSAVGQGKHTPQSPPQFDRPWTWLRNCAWVTGFYTIGPCGEELMAALGCALRPTDAMALHYRHLGTQIARQL